MVDSPVRPASLPRNGFATPSIPSRRTRRARWRDGRLLLGVLLVAVTALVGARLLSAADDTVAIWTTMHAVPAGRTLSSDDLATTRVRFTSDAVARRYLPADVTLDGKVAVRAMAAGEFVPVSATADHGESERIELPLSVAVGGLPGDLAVGDQVDVWVVPKTDSGTTEAASAVQLWERLPVLDVDSAKGVAAGSSRRQVLLGLDPKQSARLGGHLRRLGSGEPVLARRSH